MIKKLINSQFSRTISKENFSKRGVALLMVLMVISILTIVVVDISYSTRVDSEIALNQENELKAFYLAKSGFEFSKIMLRLDAVMQGKMDGITSGLSGLAGNVSIGDESVSSMMASTHIWDLLPGVAAYPPMLAGLVSSTKNDSEKSESTDKKDSEKDEEAEKNEDEYYESDLKSESCKINLNGFATEKTKDDKSSGMLKFIRNILNLEEFYEMFKDNPEQKNTIMYSIKDWIDPDNISSNMTKGGDENIPYASLKNRYKAKNTKFDSMEELMQVDGMTGEVYNKIFLKYFTVFGDTKFNIHCNIAEFAAIFKATLSPFVTMNKDEFIKQLKLKNFKDEKEYQKVVKEITGVSAELPVDKDLLQYLGNTDTKFRVLSTGYSGDSSKTIIAIMNKPKNQTQPFELLYWRVN